MAVSDEEARRRAAMAAIAAEREAAESAAAAEDAEANEPPPAAGGGPRRGLVIGGVIGAVVIVVLAVLLLAGGGDSDDSVATGDSVAADDAATGPTVGNEVAGESDVDPGATVPGDAAGPVDAEVDAPSDLPDPLPGPPLDLTDPDPEAVAAQILEYRRWLLANPDTELIPAIAMTGSPAEERLEFEVGALEDANQSMELDGYHVHIEETYPMGFGTGFHIHESWDRRRILDAETGAVVRTEGAQPEASAHVVLWPQRNGEWKLALFVPGGVNERPDPQELLAQLGD